MNKPPLSTRQLEPTAPPARALRVVVVDDERDTVVTLMAILSYEGYETRGVHDGKSALTAIAEFDPDVVIADISMPGMTGWDVAREVRKIGNQERPLLIAVSGIYVKAADRALAQMVGYKHFVPKPCDPRELLSLLAPLAISLKIARDPRTGL